MSFNYWIYHFYIEFKLCIISDTVNNTVEHYTEHYCCISAEKLDLLGIFLENITKLCKDFINEINFLCFLTHISMILKLKMFFTLISIKWNAWTNLRNLFILMLGLWTFWPCSTSCYKPNSNLKTLCFIPIESRCIFCTFNLLKHSW